tara:strand:+ start:680 stop:1051 length:372 start_codon:yes stop_codon:yes gene_type:complete
MRAFIIKIKDGLKEFFYSRFFLGAIVASILFVCVLMWQETTHETRISKMQENIQIVLRDQDNFYAKKTERLELQNFQNQMIMSSHRQIIERASGLILKYRQIIEELVKELRKHQVPIDPDKWT